MGRKLHLEKHLSQEELTTRYRKAKEAVERSHWQILWLLVQGQSVSEVAQVTGYCRNWIYQVVRRYNQHGPAVLGDQRHQNPGAALLLSAEQLARLDDALQEPPADGGLWTGRKVAAWIEQQIGHAVPAQRGWEYLRRLDYRQRVLRPRHAKADPEAQAAFKKTAR